MDGNGTVTFLTELMRLKALPRTGWLLRGVREVESIADHGFGVAWIAMLLADRAVAVGMPVSVEKVLRFALLHDLSEARTGDLPSTIKPYFPGTTLQQTDEQVTRDILQPLGESGVEYLALWHEYEQRASLEARLVKAADKLDLLCQAREYEKGGAQNLAEFWARADEDFAALGVNELITDILAALQS